MNFQTFRNLLTYFKQAFKFPNFHRVADLKIYRINFLLKFFGPSEPGDSNFADFQTLKLSNFQSFELPNLQNFFAGKLSKLSFPLPRAAILKYTYCSLSQCKLYFENIDYFLKNKTKEKSIYQLMIFHSQSIVKLNVPVNLLRWNDVPRTSRIFCPNIISISIYLNVTQAKQMINLLLFNNFYPVISIYIDEFK